MPGHGVPGSASPRGRRLTALLGRPSNIRICKSIAQAAGRGDWIEAPSQIGLSASSEVLDMLALETEVDVVDPAELCTNFGERPGSLRRCTRMAASDPPTFRKTDRKSGSPQPSRSPKAQRVGKRSRWQIRWSENRCARLAWLPAARTISPTGATQQAEQPSRIQSLEPMLTWSVTDEFQVLGTYSA